MKQCMDLNNLHCRLKKIIGQVQAIDKMIEEDIPCEDILSQINAAKSALHGCGKVILEGHIKHCVRDGIEHGEICKYGIIVNSIYLCFIQVQDGLIFNLSFFRTAFFY